MEQEFTLRVMDLITVGGSLITIVASYVTLKARLTTLEASVQDHKDDSDEKGKVIHKRVDRLRDEQKSFHDTILIKIEEMKVEVHNTSLSMERMKNDILMALRK